jgi:hypothetical protein
MADDKRAQWEPFLKAVSVAPSTETTIVGKSGVRHDILAIGADEKQRRLALIVPAPSGRDAALVQSDIQHANPDWHVIVARPVGIGIHQLAAGLSEYFGTNDLRLIHMLRHKDDVEGFFEGFMNHMKETNRAVLADAPIGWLAYVQQGLRQLHDLRTAWIEPTNPIEAGEHGILRTGGIDLSIAMKISPTGEDLLYGVCPVDLVGISKEEQSTLFHGGHVDDVRAALAKHGIYDYYFPPRDHTVLSIMDRAPTLPTARLREATVVAEKVGHPPSQNALVPSSSSFDEMLDLMKQHNLVIEGTLSVELTADGKAVRNEIKYKPREGFVSKLLNKLEATTIGDILKAIAGGD